jgi:hypothetical protein
VARLTRLAGVVAVLSIAGAAAAPHARALDGDVRLSDERTLTRWAYPAGAGWVRSRPDPAAPRVVRLRRLTQDGFPELYVALRARVGTDGAIWVQIRLPLRPNGTTGWVLRRRLGPWTTVRTALDVDRVRLRAVLRRGGRVVWRARVGVGAPGTPTPAGDFYVREKIRNLRGDPLYGPWAIGTSAYSALSEWPGGGVVGIHGTDRPGLIPGRPSHGCIRLRNGDVTELVQKLPLGTPIHIR